MYTAGMNNFVHVSLDLRFFSWVGFPERFDPFFLSHVVLVINTFSVCDNLIGES